MINHTTYTTDNIAILMATYNGADYLSEQLDSLLAQSYKDWILYIQDDLSTDKTLDIVKSYMERDKRIVLLDNKAKQGAVFNFMSLLNQVEAPYYMFADQDDVWFPDKIEVTFNELKRIEEKYNDKPIIVHTDLTVTDEKLNILNPSLWAMMRIEPSLLTNLEKMGAHCLVTGCTMMFNNKAKKVSLPIYKKAVVHDIWMTLCVFKSKGVISEIRRSTIYYRQHKENTVGAKNFQVDYIKNKIKGFPHVIEENYKYYRMLRKVGYNSFLKYLYQKISYYFAYNRITKK